jgi:hypothetical protein
VHTQRCLKIKTHIINHQTPINYKRSVHLQGSSAISLGSVRHTTQSSSTYLPPVEKAEVAERAGVGDALEGATRGGLFGGGGEVVDDADAIGTTGATTGGATTTGLSPNISCEAYILHSESMTSTSAGAMGIDTGSAGSDKRFFSLAVFGYFDVSGVALRCRGDIVET